MTSLWVVKQPIALMIRKFPNFCHTFLPSYDLIIFKNIPFPNTKFWPESLFSFWSEFVSCEATPIFLAQKIPNKFPVILGILSCHNIQKYHLVQNKFSAAKLWQVSAYSKPLWRKCYLEVSNGHEIFMTSSLHQITPSCQISSSGDFPYECHKQI